MENYLKKNFGGVMAKNSSDESLQRWRKLCGVVKNPKRRFRFTANLSKRSEAAAMRRSNQLKKERRGSTVRRDDRTGSEIKRNISLQVGPHRQNGTTTVEAIINELSLCKEGPSMSVMETNEKNEMDSKHSHTVSNPF